MRALKSKKARADSRVKHVIETATTSQAAAALDYCAESSHLFSTVRSRFA
jgi:hypothetical protein